MEGGMGLREKAIVAMLGVIVLYAIAAATWFLSAESSWKKASKAYNRAKTAYAEECKLIARRSELAEQYENEKAAMPMFEAGKATDTTWLGKMEDSAKKNLIVISQDKPGKEIEADEVLELPIEVSAWEGSLEALVKFAHEMENSNDGMFAITQISFKPSSKKGYLRGSFTLNCAYMREK